MTKYICLNPGDAVMVKCPACLVSQHVMVGALADAPQVRLECGCRVNTAEIRKTQAEEKK